MKETTRLLNRASKQFALADKKEDAELLTKKSKATEKFALEVTADPCRSGTHQGAAQ